MTYFVSNSRLAVVALLVAHPVAILTAHDHEVSSDESVLTAALYPQLSHDARTIVFSYQGAIWRMPSAGGEMLRLTSEPGFDVQPTLSPDGERIALIRTQNNSQGPLLLIRAEDGDPLPLPREIVARGRLVFDKDGKRLLGRFKHADDSIGVSLRWLDLSSGDLGPTLRNNSWTERFALSADGSQITLVTTDDVPAVEQSGNNGPRSKFWTMRSDGGTLEPLFTFPARVYHLQPTPDDSALIVVSDLGGAHYDLWRIPLDEPSRAEKLTFGQADEADPSLAADGRWLLFTDNRRGPTSMVLRDLRKGVDRTLTVAHRNFGQPTGQLDIELIDTASDGPTTARLVVQRIGGKAHAPAGAMYGMQRGQNSLHFCARAEASLELPVGDYQITAFRGPEYLAARREISIAGGEDKTVSLRLTRWIDQTSRGWHSGEAHIHANYGYGYWYNSPRTMLEICAAEDLRVCNMMVANSDGDGVFDREHFRGRPDDLSTDQTVLYWNEEFRSTIWGHMTLLNLKQLVEPIFTGFAHTTHPHDHTTNADIAELTHDQEGHVNYTHPAHNVKDPYLSAYSAKELPIDVALGTVDSIDVMGANHQANMVVWYRLLNCGFAIPASAGTDCFSNRLPARLPGEVRAYVKIDEPFSYQRWVDGLQRGRTFVTNGPMLELTAGEKQIGETISLSGPGEVRVHSRITSQFPLVRAEVVFNGKVVATRDRDPTNPATIEFDESISVPHSGWIAVRAYGEPHRDANPGQFAHTSPVYVSVEGHPNDAREDAQYFVAWIDRLWADIQTRNRVLPNRHSHVRSQIDRARTMFLKLAKPAG
jgi:TolB protein